MPKPTLPGINPIKDDEEEEQQASAAQPADSSKPKNVTRNRMVSFSRDGTPQYTYMRPEQTPATQPVQPSDNPTQTATSMPVLTEMPKTNQQKAEEQVSTPTTKWYKGSTPTRSEVMAQVYRIAQADPKRGEEAYNQFQTFLSDPTSPLYNPYSKSTNRAISELEALGIDTTGGVTHEWVENNRWLSQYYRLGNGNTPLAPTKNSSREEKAAYWYYQILKAEDDTFAAEEEWNALKEELTYWTKREDLNLTDDEVLAKIDWSKYKTLVNMDNSWKNGLTLNLNRAIGYNQDALTGVIWAARNDIDTDDGYNSVRAALGMGKQWQPNQEIQEKLDPTNEKFQPYSVGTISDVLRYFGLSEIPAGWFDENSWMAFSEDETQKKMYGEAVAAEKTTTKAEEELTDLWALIERCLKGGVWDPERITKYIDLANRFPTLSKMDESRKTGKLLGTTRAISYRWEDVYAEIQKRCNEEKEKQALAEEIVPKLIKMAGGVAKQIPGALQAAAASMVQNIQNASQYIMDLGTDYERDVFMSGYVPTHSDNVTDLADAIDTGMINGEESYATAVQQADDAAVNDYLPGYQVYKEYNDAKNDKDYWTKYLELLDAGYLPKQIEEMLAGGASSGPSRVPEGAVVVGSAGASDTFRMSGKPVGVPEITLTEEEQAKLRAAGVTSLYDKDLTPEQAQVVRDVLQAHGVMDKAQKAALNSTEQAEQDDEVERARRMAQNHIDEAQARMDSLQNDYGPAWEQLNEIYSNYDAADEIAALLGMDSTGGRELLARLEYYYDLGAKYVPTKWVAYSNYDAALNEGSDEFTVRLAANMDRSALLEELSHIDSTLTYLKDHNYKFDAETYTAKSHDYKSNVNRRKQTIQRELKGIDFFQVRYSNDFDEVVAKAKEEIGTAWGAKGLGGWWQGVGLPFGLNDNRDGYSRLDWYMVDPAQGMDLSGGVTGNDNPGLMSQVERDTYLYLRYARGEDAAKEFYDYMTNPEYGMLPTRGAEALAKSAQEVSEGSALGAAVNVGASILGSPLKLTGTIYSLYAKLTGKEINPNSAAFTTDVFTGAARGGAKQQISKRIADAVGYEGSAWDTICQVAFDGVTSSADSMVNAMLLGGGGEIEAANKWAKFGLKAGQSLAHAVPMGLQAMGGAIREAKLNDGTDEQALMMGGMTFFCETITEAITFDNLVESFQLGQAANAASWKKMLANLFTKYLDEPIAEGLNEIMEGLGEDLIMQELSERNRRVTELTQDGTMLKADAEALAWQEFWTRVGMAAATGAVSSQAGNVTSFFGGVLSRGANLLTRNGTSNALLNSTVIGDTTKAVNQAAKAVGQAVQPIVNAPAPTQQTTQNAQAAVQAVNDAATNPQQVIDFVGEAAAQATANQQAEQTAQVENREAQVEERGNVAEPEMTNQEIENFADAAQSTANIGAISALTNALESVGVRNSGDAAQVLTDRLGDSANDIVAAVARATKSSEVDTVRALNSLIYAAMSDEGSLPAIALNRLVSESTFGIHSESVQTFIQEATGEKPIAVPVNDPARTASQLTSLNTARTGNAAAQATAVGAVFLPAGKRDLYSKGTAIAAGISLVNKYGSKGVKAVQDGVALANTINIPTNQVTDLMELASLADESTAMATALDSVVNDGVTEESIAALRAAAEVEAQAPDFIPSTQRKVYEYMLALQLKDAISKGSMKDVASEEEKLNTAKRKKSDADKALEEATATQEQMQENLQATQEALRQNPGDNTLVTAARQAVDALKGQIKVVAEYTMSAANAAADMQAKQAKLDQAVNDALNTARETASEELDAALAAEAETEQQQKAEAVAAAVEEQAQIEAENQAKADQEAYEQAVAELPPVAPAGRKVPAKTVNGRGVQVTGVAYMKDNNVYYTLDNGKIVSQKQLTNPQDTMDAVSENWGDDEWDAAEAAEAPTVPLDKSITVEPAESADSYLNENDTSKKDRPRKEIIGLLPTAKNSDDIPVLFSDGSTGFWGNYTPVTKSDRAMLDSVYEENAGLLDSEYKKSKSPVRPKGEQMTEAAQPENTEASPEKAVTQESPNDMAQMERAEEGGVAEGVQPTGVEQGTENPVRPVGEQMTETPAAENTAAENTNDLTQQEAPTETEIAKPTTTAETVAAEQRKKFYELAEKRGLTGEKADAFAAQLEKYAADRTAGKIDMSKRLSKSEGSLLMGILEKRFGVKVELGNLGKGRKGMYDPKTNKITLSQDLPGGQVMVEFYLHELTHALENTQAYQRYHDTVLDILYSTKDALQKAIADKVAAYAKDGIGIDVAQAEREIVADYARTELNNRDSIYRMVREGIGGNIRNALHNINQFFKNLQLSAEERKFAENLRRAERQFQRALSELTKNKGKTTTTTQTTTENAIADGLMTQAEMDQALLEAGEDYRNALERGDTDAAEEDVRFALETPTREFTPTKAPIQLRTDGMMAVHNLSADNLSRAFSTNGLIGPSIGVLSTNSTWTKYGDISLFFGKDTVDPSIGSSNLFAGDAGTPMVWGDFSSPLEALQQMSSQNFRAESGGSLYNAMSNLRELSSLEEGRKRLSDTDSLSSEEANAVGQAISQQIHSEVMEYMQKHMYGDKAVSKNENPIEYGRQMGSLGYDASVITNALLESYEAFDRFGLKPGKADMKAKTDIINRKLYENLHNNFKLTGESGAKLAEAIVEGLEKLDNIHANKMLESKSKRIVNFSEAKAVALPTNTPQSIINNLRNKFGIKDENVRFYDPNATDGPTSREAVLKNIPREVEGVEFAAGDDAAMTDAEMEAALQEAGVTDEGTAAETNAPTGERQFGTETAQNNRSVLYEKVKEYLKQHSEYTKDTNKAQMDRAIDWIAEHSNGGDPSGMYGALTEAESPEFNPMSPDGQAKMVALMGLAATASNQNEGTQAQLRLADMFNEQGTLAGQTLQARKLFQLMTPSGRMATLKKLQDRINQNYAKEGSNTRVELSDWVLRAAGEAETEAEMTRVREAAEKELAQQMPASWKEKLQSWRMMSMLLNPRTHIRNIVGNAMFVPAVAMKNKIGATMELTGRTAERTKTLAPVTSKTIRNFARQDAKAIKDVLTGEAKYNESTKLQQKRDVFKFKPLQWLSDINSKFLEGEDWFFLKGHYRRALGGWMQANGYTVEQLKGNEELLNKGRAYAVNEAQKATYRDFNQLSATLNQISRKGGGLGFAVDAILPFKKTPANILRRGVEYSPVGLARSLTTDLVHLKEYKDWQNGKLAAKPEKAISANQWIDKFASGLSGTAVALLGAMLSHSGVVTTDLDDDDDEFDKLEGKQEYSINIMGHNFTVDWAAPLCMPFFVGAALEKVIYQDKGDIDIQGIVNSIADITEPVFNLSMLDGVNSLFQTSQYDDTNNITQIGAKVLSNYVTSYVPSVLGAVARSYDPIRRKAFVKSGEGNGVVGTFRYAKEQTENKIPGVSQSNIPVRDAFGRMSNDELTERILENFVSPGYHTETKSDPVVEGLHDLYNKTGDSSLIPKMPNRKLGDRALEDKEYDQITKERGEMAYSIISELMQDKSFQKAPNEDKVSMIEDAWTYATKQAGVKIDSTISVPAWVKKVSGNPSKGIVQRWQDRVDAEYKAGYKNAAIEAVEKGNMEALDTAIRKYEEAGGSKTSIKTEITKQYKQQYIDAYNDTSDKGFARWQELEDMLLNSGLYTSKDLQKWLTDYEKEKVKEELEDIP